MGGPHFDVFLSYDRDDAAVVVEQVAQRLRRERLQPWLDRWFVTPGGKWQQEIARDCAPRTPARSSSDLTAWAIGRARSWR